MSGSLNWTSVQNKKKDRRRKRLQERAKYREKWGKLIEECPHIVTPERAKRLYRKLNIDKLDIVFLSEEWILYQKAGWKYVRTLKSRPNQNSSSFEREGFEYSTLELNNGWGDKALFCRELTDKHL